MQLRPEVGLSRKGWPGGCCVEAPALQETGQAVFPISGVEVREDSWREGLLPAPGRAGTLQPARASCLPWQEAVSRKVPLLPLWAHRGLAESMF